MKTAYMKPQTRTEEVHMESLLASESMQKNSTTTVTSDEVLGNRTTSKYSLWDDDFDEE